MQGKQKGNGAGGDNIKGLDLAMKNIELKEEIRVLKEKQNTFVRESLQHQYMRYRLQVEIERVLQAQKEGLLRLIEQTEEALQAVKNASLPAPATGPQPFKENPSAKTQTRRAIKRQNPINFI